MRTMIAYCGLDCETCQTVAMVIAHNPDALKNLRG